MTCPLLQVSVYYPRTKLYTILSHLPEYKMSINKRILLHEEKHFSEDSQLTALKCSEESLDIYYHNEQCNVELLPFLHCVASSLH